MEDSSFSIIYFNRTFTKRALFLSIRVNLIIVSKLSQIKKARDSQQVILRSSWVRKTIINQEFEKRDKTAINLTKKKCRSTPQNVH
ncbi:unnamed protein product [Oikopleura dioica]|uniref:Uncharacterized protein n=1 Tax=Oikopleura dioica TaxID=34765 RepID=E4Y911_OIKDI|nr:unnamed protein product [Oikopleura dioica]